MSNERKANHETSHHTLAEGGFEVSAEQIRGTIASVKIHSSSGGEVKLLSPWKGGFKAIDEPSGAEVSVTADGEEGSFATTVGTTYRIEPADRKPPMLDGRSRS